MANYYCIIDGQEIGLEVTHSEDRTIIRPIDREGGAQATVDFAPVHMDVDTGEGLYSLIADGRSFQVHVERTEEGLRMVIWHHRYPARVLTEREYRLEKVAPRLAAAGGHKVIKAPMPGLVKALAVSEGDVVHSGQQLIVLEAMKMENDITAPSAGRVSQIHVTPGSTVEGGKPLVTLE